jgi:hypothetical protein
MRETSPYDGAAKRLGNRLPRPVTVEQHASICQWRNQLHATSNNPLTFARLQETLK